MEDIWVQRVDWNSTGGVDSYRLSLDQPEADPGAEDDEGERSVDLEQEEAGLTFKEKVELHTGVISEAESVPPARNPDGLTVAFVCQVELSQGHLVSNSERLLLPPQTEFYNSRQNFFSEKSVKSNRIIVPWQ